MSGKRGPLDEFDRQQLFKLLKESVSANTLNSKTSEGIKNLQEDLSKNMLTLNDNFVFHRQNTEENIKLIKDDLLKYIKGLVFIIFVLLGGVIITKALGFDIISYIQDIGT